MSSTTSRNIRRTNAPGVAPVEEAGGLHFLTMELVEGQPLDRVIPTAGLPTAPG